MNGYQLVPLKFSNATYQEISTRIFTNKQTAEQWQKFCGDTPSKMIEIKIIE